MSAVRSTHLLHPPRPRHRTGPPSPAEKSKADDDRLRLAVVAVGVVVPLLVLAMCLCLPRRQSAAPTRPTAVELPPVAAAPPAVIPVANKTDTVVPPNPELPAAKEPPPAPQVAVARGNGDPPPPQEGNPLNDDVPAPVQPPLPPARVEKPLATLTLPPRPDREAVRESCPKGPAGDYGTAVHFARDPAEAARLAKAADKLMVVFTISGNFEDSKFT
jgi:type IV secretory pathway VirB10-like protein